jgi:outer membrane protein assembly factor BamB
MSRSARLVSPSRAKTQDTIKRWKEKLVFSRWVRLSLCLAAGLVVAGGLQASDWSHWRGPGGNGVSPETGLIDSWSAAGENLLWRVDFTGRSTPVVLGDRVCANGRAGEGDRRQEMVACFDAATGKQLWERRFNVYHTSVPWTRVGWANITGDPETGYLYVQGVGGLFHCLDSADGRVVWSRQLIEQFGFMEGYGGRTQTPIVDEDRLIVTFANTAWGNEGRPLHRLRAFDKHTGEQLWVSSPASSMSDKNSQSTPAVAVIGGQRLVIQGNGGGWIYAVQARTGEPVWGFHLSKRGINTSVLVDGTTVYALHSEENVDEGTMGRVVAIDATGSGDVTATHEIWRTQIGAGYTSPTLAEGKLFVVDNSANLHALDAASGEELWELNIGRVGKGSPVYADGKIYLTEVNGRFVIAKVGEESGEILDMEQLRVARRRPEIYGSPAIAHGRIFFTTDEGLYALGRVEATPETASGASLEEPASAADGPPAKLLVVPGDVQLSPGELVDFRVEAFDSRGRSLGESDAVLSTQGLAASINGNQVSIAGDATSATGQVVAKLGELEASARVRVIPILTQSEDFEATEIGSRPGYMLGYLSRFAVAEYEGGRVLAKRPSPVKIHRHITFLGGPWQTGYTIEADLKADADDPKGPDLGLINSGYTMELLSKGARPGLPPGPKLHVRSWQAGLRIAEDLEFQWTPGVWYRMKLRVEQQDEKAVIQGKVWPRGETEPAEWMITVEDPLPIRKGSAGLSGYSPSPIYFDNILVSEND